jgi:hypothetical protein
MFLKYGEWTFLFVTFVVNVKILLGIASLKSESSIIYFSAISICALKHGAIPKNGTFIRMVSILLIANCFTTKNIGGAKELVVLLLLSANI